MKKKNIHNPQKVDEKIQGVKFIFVTSVQLWSVRESFSSFPLSMYVFAKKKKTIKKKGKEKY